MTGSNKFFKIVPMLIITVLILTVSGCTETQADTVPAPIQTATPVSTTTPTPTPESSVKLDESIEYLVQMLESDPDIIDADVSIDGKTVSIAITTLNPNEADRIYIYTSTMSKIQLKEHGIVSVLIGVYKGDEQLKLDAYSII